ncbi:hypothetical protein DSM05_13045 [Pseudomonas sp. FW305-3-2-15-E-TSA4]|nr:hypothetical protein [Pseudomonas sp. FW305-3-2-15-E-TSA4]
MRGKPPPPLRGPPPPRGEECDSDDDRNPPPLGEVSAQPTEGACQARPSLWISPRAPAVTSAQVTSNPASSPK